MRFLGLLLWTAALIDAQTLGQLRLVDFSHRTPATVVSNAKGALVISPGSFSLSTGQCVYIYQPVTLDQDRTLFSVHGNIGRGYFCVSVTDSTHWTITSEMYSNNPSTGNGTTAGDKIVPLTTYYLRSGPRVALDGPIDEGAWKSSTPYRALQMVQAPDTKYYVAVQDNTNQQPPNAAYWRQVDHSKVGPGTYTASLRSAAVRKSFSYGEVATLFNLYFNKKEGFDYNTSNGQNGALPIPYWVSSGDNSYLAAAQRVALQAEDSADGSVQCDIKGASIAWCGRGSAIDYARLATGELAFFESMIDWTLTDAQRQTYANKVLNDNDTSHNGVDTSACKDMPKYQPDKSAADQLTCQRSVCTLPAESSIDFTNLANFGVGSAIIGYPYNNAAEEALGRVKSVDGPHQFTVVYVTPQWSRFNWNSNGTPYPDVLGFAAGAKVLRTLTGSANPWYFTPPWDDAAHYCGVKWWVTHHGSGPNLIPDQVSHYLADYNLGSSDFSRINNRTISAMQGQVAWGLTTADFDIRGVRMAEQAINYYMTQWLAQNAKSRWAAFNGHGNQYGPQRVAVITAMIAWMIHNSLTVTPPGVLTGGYLTNLARGMAYAVWNASPHYMQVFETGYGPCFNGDIQACQQLQTLTGLFAIARLYPSDVSSGWTWDYFHNRRGDYNRSYGAGGWTALNFQPYGLALDDPSATAVSVSTNTLQQGLFSTDAQECIDAGLYCLPDAPHAVSVSTTGWSSTDTSVQVQAPSTYLMGDDLENYAPAGAIAIYQNNGANSNALLGGNGLIFMSAISPNGGTYDSSIPMIYSPTTGYQSPPYSSEYANAITDRWAGKVPDGPANNSYAYLRVNYNPKVRQAPHYSAVQRSWFQVAGKVTREVLHFKNGSNNPNYLLVYDAFSGVAPGNRLESLWHLVTMPNLATKFKVGRHPEWVTTDYSHQAASMVAPNTGRLNIKSFAVSGSSNRTVALTDDSYEPPYFSGFPGQDHAVAATSPPTWTDGVAKVAFVGVPYNAYSLPVGTPVQIRGIHSTGPGSFNGTFKITSYSPSGPTITYSLPTNPGTYVNSTGPAQVSIAGWCTWVSPANPTASCAGNYPRTNAPFNSSSWPGTFRLTSCASSDGSTCDTETAAEILTLLVPSTNASATLPPTNQPSCSATGGSCFTFEIKDSTYPAVAMMARNGALVSGMSTTSTHSGTANYVVSGLQPGTYNITRNGAQIASAKVASGDTTLQFTSTAGTIVIK